MRRKKKQEPLYRVENKATGRVSFLSLRGVDALTQSSAEAGKYIIDIDAKYAFLNGEYVSHIELSKMAKPITIDDSAKNVMSKKATKATKDDNLFETKKEGSDEGK